MKRKVKTAQIAKEDPRESDEQKIVFQWLEANNIFSWHTPNELGRSGAWKFSSILRAIGKRKGIHDLTIPDPAPANGKSTALEMKKVGGGKISAEQKIIHDRMRQCGWNVIIGRGADDAIRQLKELGYGSARRDHEI